MGRVLTNELEVAYAIEETPGVLPDAPEWRTIEPNSPSGFGNTISVTTRAPITKDRQRRQGSVTDLDSSPEFEADLTISHMRDFAEGFCYSRAVGGPVLRPSAAAADTYTVPAVDADDAAKFIYDAAGAKSLVFARGFGDNANNGLSVLGGAVAAAAVAVTVAGAVAEAAPPADAVLELAIAGVRGADGDLEVDADGNLISTALDFTTLGLTAGQSIHLGGVDATTNFALPANTGFARVMVIEQNKLTLDRRSSVFEADDGTDTGAGGNGIAVDILFGQFVRNVASDHEDYLERSYQFELASPNLGEGGETLYEYAQGNYANTITVTVPLTDKATLKLGFVGQSTTDPESARASGAASALVPGQTEAFGTADDIARLFLNDSDENGLTTDFKSITLALTNNASGEKVLGHLGSKYINTGNIEADLDTEMLFTSPDTITRIRRNEAVGMGFCLRNEDGGIAFDLPEGTLEGGERDYAVNESVKIKSKFMSHKCPTLGTSIGISFFPALPANA